MFMCVSALCISGPVCARARGYVYVLVEWMDGWLVEIFLT